MKNSKRIISLVLAMAMLLGCFPAAAFAVDNTVYSLDNGYITVDVSGENGGFAIKTNKGNSLKKSDNEKKLLYHSGEYDTSFLSFRVDGKDYIFGGSYAGSSGVTVSQTSADGEIIAQWSLGELLFTEIISLPNTSSSEHGMVSITAGVTNNGSKPVNVKARLLMDTYLNNIDYAFYEIGGNTVKNETIISGSDVPQNFYAVDDMAAPMVQAYVVNSTLPESIAFGHWSRLASTIYDFTPDTELDFSNSINSYMTADSAYAMYFDLGDIAAADAGTFTSCYGVYSNSSVPVSDSVAINASAPMRLYLNENRSAYTYTPGIGAADFQVSAILENYESETSADLENLTLIVRSTSGVMPLNRSGQQLTGMTYTSTDPYEISYESMAVGEIINQPLYFKANLKNDASYERINLEVYTGDIVDTNLLGEKIIYILVPGTNGDIPVVTFASMTPDAVYSSGTRHLYLTVSNENMLANKAHWNLYVYPAGQTFGGIQIPHENLSIKDGVMDIAITDDIRLATGSWYVQLEWTAEAVSEGIVDEACGQTSGNMRFTVSDNPKYKNDTYGILTVAKFYEGNDSYCYQLRHFSSETDLAAFKKTAGTEYKGHGKFMGTLMDIRGEFTAQEGKKIYDANNSVVGYTNYTAISTKTLNEETRKYNVDNCITINNCLDFEGGTISVYHEGNNEGGAICVEFDGELYTSDARTSVWKGKAAFTKIEQGDEFSLIKYDENGERDDSEKDSGAEHITLIWPNVFGAAQSLLGMAFKMAFAQLGVMMKDEDDVKDGEDPELGRVLSFSAQLSLDFMQDNPDHESDPSKQTYFDKIKGLWDLWKEDTPSLYQYAYNAGRINKLLDFKTVDEEEDEDAKRGVSAAVNVPDILFGCGEGFVGLHFKVKVGLKNMIDALPTVTGELEVNTINDWSFGFEGEMKLEKFEMEATLSFKSHDNVPVPDEIYFFIGGFKPGINVDGMGVMWLQGGGGGISNLYDTIFLSQSVPPLKLCVAMSFSIVQILDGKAKLELGLTGFKLEAEDLKIFGEIECIENILLSLEWYPGIELKAGINVNLFQGIIEGQGYIVLIGKDYTDWFFEMFARAELKIPKSIPVVGGMSIMSADLGISTEKIWGAIAVIGIGVGVTYYWGESSVNFGSAKDKANPTYPSLLEFEGVDAEYDAVPVCYDEETGRTLYAHFGNNLEVVPAVVGDGELELLGVSALKTSTDYMTHKFTAGNDAVVQLSFDAENEEAALSTAKTFSVKDGSGNDFGLIFYDDENANANVSFDSDTNIATLAFTVTDAYDFNREWTISTGVKTSAILYNVEPLPNMAAVSGSDANAGSAMTFNWSGTNLDELDKISFFLCGDADIESTQESFDGGYFTGELKTELASGSAQIVIPATIPGGDYYVRAVYSEEDIINGTIYSSAKVHVENNNVPESLTSADVTCVPGGNLVYDLSVAPKGNTTGYSVSVYNQDGSRTDITDLEYEIAANGLTEFSVGGSYVYEGTTYGLTGNKKYKIGITPYNVFTESTGEYIIMGEEYVFDAGILPRVTAPEMTVRTTETSKNVDYEYVDSNKQLAYGTKNVYTVDTVHFAFDADVPVSAKVFLDDEEIYGNDQTKAPYMDGVSAASLVCSGLSEGDHVLKITGKDAEGDGFTVNEAFTVDTLAPRLMLTSPVNGSYFSKSGELTVSGITDCDSIMGVCIDRTQVLSGYSAETAADGTFSFTVTIPDHNSASSFSVSIEVSDKAGNSTENHVRVYHGGLASLDGLKLMNGDAVLESGAISTCEGSVNADLSALGTAEGQAFVLPREKVYWDILVAEGNASINSAGLLRADQGAKGMVIARYEVSENAYLSAELVFSDDIPLIVEGSVGGSVKIGGNPVAGGSAILTAVPDAGYVFDHWTIDGIDAGTDPTGTFTMPLSGSVHITAVFRPAGINNKDKNDILQSVEIPADISAEGYIPYYIDNDGNEVIIKVSGADDGRLYYLNFEGREVLFKNVDVSFEDIEGHWAKEAIEFCADRGIFNGVGEGKFDPEGTMTRAMFITVLWNLEGCPEPEGSSSFDDVSDGAWYSKAAAWGAETGLAAGVGSNMFAPDRSVTREQMCVLVSKYINYCGYPVKSGSRTGFTDAGNISSWALGNVDFCSGAGIVSGYPDGSFKPQGDTTRAACCAVFYNLINTILDAYK